ncbi:MAG: LTA synthase family protein, partial [Oscillospiraceae bacterium]|nr:LTA synthase family protein [Oscillospiraceae bacterium]
TELSDEPFFFFFLDILAPYKLLKVEGFHGTLVVPNYGGGTANTEFDVLTGLYSMYINPSPTAFRHVRKPFPSVASVFRENGYQTPAIHPGHGWVYRRERVYPRLGFGEFLTEKRFDAPELKGGLIADRAAFAKLREVFETRPSPSFSYMVTIQNHTPFENRFERGARNFTQARPFLSPAETDILSNYFIGAADTARELKLFTDFLNGRPEPTLLVFYGDHLPSLGPAMRLYDELGFNKGLKKYETPFLFWRNDASKQFFNLEKAMDSCCVRRGDKLSAHYLGALTLELLGLDGGLLFFQYLNALRRTCPVLTIYGPPANARAAADYHTVLYNRLKSKTPLLTLPSPPVS